MAEIDLYTEHAKLREHAAKVQAAEEFIEYLEDRGIQLALYDKGLDVFHPVFSPVRHLLAEWVGCNPARLDDERDHMLRVIRGEI